MIRCVCGINERECMREQQREQSGDCCADRRLLLDSFNDVTATITACSVCGKPAHASETDDLDRCEDCRPASCYWCDAVATRTTIERDPDDAPHTREACDDCGASCDRAEAMRKHEADREAHGDYIRDQMKDCN